MTRAQKTSPLSKDDWLQLGLQQAGVTKQELADAVREAFDENRQLLKAVKTETKVIDGMPVKTESPDNTARQKAIESIYDIAGVRGRRAESTGDSGPVITINVPSYYDRQFLKDEGVVDVSSDPIEDNRDDP